MDTLKLVSFNINGIRARPHQLEALLATHQPDVVGLQETKCPDDQFPHAHITALGYHVAYFGQKGHYGVALVSKQPLEDVVMGFPEDDAEAQKRVIMGTLPLAGGKRLHVFNGYFPQGDSRNHPVKFPAKQKYYEDLQALLAQRYRPEDLLVVMGDFNISPTDADIGIGEVNAKRWLKQGKCSFLPEERVWLSRLQSWGLTDAFRHKHPDEDNLFSWFDYRSRGFEGEPKRGLRIDLLMVTAGLRDRLVDAGVDYDLRGMDKPSDHAPVWATFSLG